MADTLPHNPARASTTLYTGASRPAQSTLPDVRWCAVADLQVDYEYQHRPYSHAIEALKRDFQPDHCGFILVNQRADKSLWILDGQTRHAVHEQLGFRWIKAEMLSNLTQAQEAQIYLIKCINAKRMPVDFFLAEYVAGQPTAVRIHTILGARGLAIESYATSHRRRSLDTPPVVTCVSHLKRMMQKDASGETLKMTLDLIHDTWGYSGATVAALFLSTLHSLMSSYGAVIDRKAFMHKLGAQHPHELRLAAGRVQLGRKVTLQAALQEVIIEAYNSGRPAGRRIQLGA